MVKSMTGYGKATGEINNKKITIETKSLNSKQADISVRMPSLYKSKELELRSHINKCLERGKIELNLFVELLGGETNLSINKDLFKKYFNELKEIANDLNESTDLFPIVAKLPDVFKSERAELDKKEWDYIFNIINEAIAQLNEFRLKEGQSLDNELKLRVTNIKNLLAEVSQYEQVRIEVVREKLKNNLQEVISSDKINEERLEQELIYYIEKLDVTEEKTRLSAHCSYFEETMNTSESSGKKLGFIAQEMGREINTLGSKANNADLQKIVVQMKDELEKIKEQVLNIL